MLFIYVVIFTQCYFNGNAIIWKRNLVQYSPKTLHKKVKTNVETNNFDLMGSSTGNVQYQQEEQLPNGTVVGKYGIVDPDGKYRLVHYTADQNGYRPKEEIARIESIVEDNTLKNVSPKDLKIHNQLADFNTIKSSIIPSEPTSGNLKLYSDIGDPSSFDRVPSDKLLDKQGSQWYSSNYRPNTNTYHSKYYPDYYPTNNYYQGGGGSNFYPESRGYGYSYPNSYPTPYPNSYPNLYNYAINYGPTLPTKYHHTSQMYPQKVDPPIPNYYPLSDIPPPKIPQVGTYPTCCSG